MTATLTTPNRPPTVATGRGRAPGRHAKAWAWAGAAAGVAGIGMVVVSGAVSASEAALTDNTRVLGEIADKEVLVWAFQVLCSVAALGIAIFAGGLRRRLADQAPADSLLPFLAAAGLGAVAIMPLVGGGISTELFWSISRGASKTDPDTIGAHLAIFDTISTTCPSRGGSRSAPRRCGTTCPTS